MISTTAPHEYFTKNFTRLDREDMTRIAVRAFDLLDDRAKAEILAAVLLMPTKRDMVRPKLSEI